MLFAPIVTLSRDFARKRRRPVATMAPRAIPVVFLQWEPQLHLYLMERTLGATVVEQCPGKPYREQRHLIEPV